VLQTYGIIVAVSDKNEAQAFKLTVNPGESLFAQVVRDNRSRIQETAVSAEALLPEGPFNLWRQGETSRRVKDLVGAFAQFPHLPKMLRRKEILDTLCNPSTNPFWLRNRLASLGMVRLQALLSWTACFLFLSARAIRLIGRT